MNAPFWGGLVLVAAGAIATLSGHFGWGFLALVAGFCLVLGRFRGEALHRYGGALVAACLGVVLLMPLSGGRLAEPPPAPPTPPREPAEAPAETAGLAGLTEQTRRDIFREVALARVRAEREAVAAHPDADSIRPANPEKEARRAQKRQRLARTLEEKHLEEIASRQHLTREQVAEILKEGLARGWDRP